MASKNTDDLLSDSDNELHTGRLKSNGEAYAMNMRSIAMTSESLERIESVRTSSRTFFSPNNLPSE